jgi:DNA-binding response OmpR family regulator
MGMPEKKKKVLIVDDERPVANMIANALSGEGYETAEVVQALRFYDNVLAEHPDLILLDLMMPYLEGEDELQLLKMNDDTSHIPVIVVTAMPVGDARKRVQQFTPFPVVDILSKPFNLEKLIGLVNKAIGS